MSAEGPHRFPESSPGYDPATVDHVIGHLEDERRSLETRIEELARERDELERDLAKLRGELDATRAALPEIGELRGRLEGLEGEYGERVAALERLLVSVARELAARERGSTGSTTSPERPVRGSWSGPEGQEDPGEAR